VAGSGEDKVEVGGTPVIERPVVRETREASWKMRCLSCGLRGCGTMGVHQAGKMECWVRQEGTRCKEEREQQRICRLVWCMGDLGT
jgi:hypothetical protein